MESLENIVEHVISGYAKAGLNGRTFLAIAPDRALFTVVGIAKLRDKRFSNASLIVRLADGQILIELDMNDKPLVDALLQAGVPREKITLVYAGEPVPEALEVI